MTRTSLSAFLVLATLLTAGGAARAQRMDGRQAQARLAALERLAAPASSDVSIVGLIGGALSGEPIRGIGTLLARQAAPNFWAHVIDETRHLYENAAPVLVRTPPALIGQAAVTSVPLRHMLERFVSRLPPVVAIELSGEWRAEADKLQAKWRTTKNLGFLRELVHDYPGTGAAFQAAEVLGDLAFEDGRFHEALAWWAQAARGATPEHRVRCEAKHILGLIFLGRLDQADAALAPFRRDFPEAKGDFAGRDGPLGNALAHWLKVRRARIAEDELAPWPTFAGAATRSRTLAVPLTPRLWHEGQSWRAAFAKFGMQAPATGAVRAPLLKMPPFYPIISDGLVLVSDGRTVSALRLVDGEQQFRFAVTDIPGARGGGLAGQANIEPGQPAPNGLAAHDGLVYATLHDTLICLSLREGNGPPGSLRWHAGALDPDGRAGFFASTPLARDNQVFAVIRDKAANQDRCYLACYGAKNGARKWIVPLEGCRLPAPGRSSPPLLLSSAGDRLVFATHRGQVVAVDPWSGRTLWRVDYPSDSVAGIRTELPRPALYDDGLVIVAPADHRQVQCLDAVSGAVRWELPGIDVTHVLGVARGVLVLATQSGLECLDLRTGGVQDRRREPSVGRLPSVGRGLLAEDTLFWPTNDSAAPLRAVSIPFSASTLHHLVHSVPAGNLQFGEGCLVIATLEELVVYRPGKFSFSGRE